MRTYQIMKYLGIFSLIVIIFPINVTASGAFLPVWNKSFHGNYKWDYAYSIAIDNGNNVYIVGDGYDLVGGDTIYDWWIKKLDTDGVEDTINWNKSFDGNQGSDGAKAVSVDNAGNVYVAGRGENIASGSSRLDWWIKKFSSDGVEDTANWNKIFDGVGLSDYCNALIIDSANNVYTAGSGIDIVGGGTSNDWWIKKFSSDGVEDTANWNKKYDGNAGRDGINSIAISGNGDIYVVGDGYNLVGGDTNYDWWIKKFDSNGIEDSVNWNKSFDGNGESDSALSVVVDNENYIYVVGYGENLVGETTNADWWLKKFNSSGHEDTMNWNKTYDYMGYHDVARTITIDDEGDIYVAGSASTDHESSSRNWWVKKFSPDGVEDTVNWNKIFDANGGEDVAQAIKINTLGDIFIAGYGEDIMSDSSQLDWWIIKFSETGTTTTTSSTTTTIPTIPADEFPSPIIPFILTISVISLVGFLIKLK